MGSGEGEGADMSGHVWVHILFTAYMPAFINGLDHTAMDEEMDKDMEIGMNMDMDRGPLEVKLSIPKPSDKLYARKQNHELFWLKAQF